MNDINFVKRSPNTVYQETATWLKISIVLLFMLVFSLTFITIRQWLKIKASHREICQRSIETKSLDKTVKEKRTLTNQKKMLNKQFTKLHKLRKKPKQKPQLLTQIFKLLPQKTKIKTISIKKTDLDLSMQSPNEKIANWIVQHIQNLPDVKRVKLASIQKKTAQFLYTIKGTLHKK